MTNDPPIAEQWHAALDGRERSEAPVYVPDVALAAPGQRATGGRVNFRLTQLRGYFLPRSHVYAPRVRVERKRRPRGRK
jgi:hypothetical protein